MSRQVRVETRSRHQNDLKRVMHSTEKVRKWEKKWVRIEETSLQIFKWMPITKNEEQQRQQIEQQISAPVSTETLITTSQDSSYSQESYSKKNQENIRSRNTVDQKLDRASAIQASVTSATTTRTKMNGSGDARKMSELTLGDTMSTVPPDTLHSSNPNKRLHEGSDEANESINSPNSKRIKTTGDILTTTGITELVDSRSTLASMHSADPVSSPVPQTIPQPQASQPSQHAMNETSHHLQQVSEAPFSTQQHVQPTITTTTTTNDAVAAKLTTPNSGGDIEMMDTEESFGHIEQPQPPPQTMSPVSNMTDALMEDFSSIVRNVTEQIVIKVSDCYGGDN